MKIPHCHYEQQVLDAVRSGRWSGPWGEDLRKHAAGCAVCTEVAMVAGLLLEDHELAQAEAQLPSAGLVWWKAQLAARRAAEERAAQPIAFVERLTRAFLALAAVGIALWQWPRIAAAAAGFLGASKSVAPAHLAASAEWTGRASRLLDIAGQGLGTQSSAWLAVASAGSLLALMAFAAYVVLREE